MNLLNKKMDKMLWVGVISHCLLFMFDCLFNSLFLFVFGDECMICHTGAYVNSGEDGDA